MKFRTPAYLLVLSTLLFAACGKKVQMVSYSIIPEPVEMTETEGSFSLTSRTRLCFGNIAQNSPTAKYITSHLRKMHIHPAFIGTPEKNCITFTLLDSLEGTLGEEGYRLRVDSKGIFVEAGTDAGLFYGFQTLLQMLPDDASTVRYRRVVMPGCAITDHPRFPWRGSHLDASRHFFPVEQIKKHLDLMAAYKLNKFLWHLADDQGWRIEIDGYPQLNDIGSWRVDRTEYPWGEEPPPEIGEEPTYGGFYSREDIADIVEYATQRHIEIIPAIEIPGHCSALLAAYPELACDGHHYDIAIGPLNPSPALLCAGNNRTVDFIFGILDEVMQLFPSDYIHIGGNEILTDSWEHCPKCRARMHELHMSKASQLQGWIVDTVAAYLSRKGKRIVGQDGTLDCGATVRDAAIISSYSSDITRRVLHSGYLAVSAPDEFCRLDSYQADPQGEPSASDGLVTLEKVYSFNPMPDALPAVLQHRFLGAQATLWTEYINTYEQAEYMLLPRLCALAECFWSPVESKAWDRFLQKIEHHKVRLRTEGYNFYDK